ncbi:MAG: (Fe-S)-binding protein [Promethearchaeota archaeon]
MKIKDIISKCTECKICEQNCSIFIHLNKFAAWEKLGLINKLTDGNKLTKNEIDGIFTCTKCEACESICPEELPLMEVFDWARHIIVEEYGFYNPKQPKIINNILKFGNPFGEKLSDDLKNIFGLYHKKQDTLLYLGCMFQYRLTNTSKDIIKILDILNVEFQVLQHETCCGYFIWNTGDHSSAKKVIDQNIGYLKKFKRIIVACAGCFTFLKSHYLPKLPDTEIIHISEIIAEQLKEKYWKKPEKRENITDIKDLTDYKLKLKKKKIVFHDSCHLARPYGIVKPPRDILEFIGYDIYELKPNKSSNLCCGADGGMRFINPELAKEIALHKLKEVSAVADDLFTLCPFCFFNFQEALGDKKEEENKKNKGNEDDEGKKLKLNIQNLFTELINFLENNIK